jgi:hypothetical protein
MVLVPTEELAFRSRPEIAPETLIRRIPVTEQLISLDPPSFAIEKVGVIGKWLKVRDQRNKVGFVAAWYVKYAGGSTSQQPSTTEASATASRQRDGQGCGAGGRVPKAAGRERHDPDPLAAAW